MGGGVESNGDDGVVTPTPRDMAVVEDSSSHTIGRDNDRTRIRSDSIGSKGRLQLSQEQIIPISGALSGFISGLAVCPLDVAKTRLQAQGAYLFHLQNDKTPIDLIKYNESKYDGLIKAMTTIWKEEKLPGLYRGVVPITLGYFPSWMIYFTIYENCKKKLTSQGFNHTNVNYFISAVTAGAISTTIANPIWVVKTRLMLQIGNGKTIYQRFDPNFQNSRDYYTSTFNCFKKMFQNEGIKSFYSGLLPSYFGLVHVAIHFPLYENFKKLLHVTNEELANANANSSNSNANANNGGTSKYILAKLILSSATSKMIASGITYPHEILRTRLQIKNNDILNAKDINLVSTFKSIWHNQGIKGFYAGFAVNLARTVPANAITLVSFDMIKTYLEVHCLQQPQPQPQHNEHVPLTSID